MTQRLSDLTCWSAALGLLLASLTITGLYAIGVKPGAETVVAVYPPWWSDQQVYSAVAMADVSIVRVAPIRNLIVVRPNERGDFGRLSRSGTILLVDAIAASACIRRLDGGGEYASGRQQP